MRKTRNEIDSIKRAIADILYNHKDELTFIDGKPSPTQISKMLEKRGLNVTRQSVGKFIDGGVEEYRKTIVIADNDRIIDIKEAMAVQKQIWQNPSNKPSDRSKAANSWKALNKQLIEYERQLTDARLRKAEVQKPNYLIKIEPPNIVKVCPKCGHEFYDMHYTKKKDAKFKITKDCDEQNVFDDFDGEEDGKK